MAISNIIIYKVGILKRGLGMFPSPVATYVGELKQCSKGSLVWVTKDGHTHLCIVGKIKKGRPALVQLFEINGIPFARGIYSNHFGYLDIYFVTSFGHNWEIEIYPFPESYFKGIVSNPYDVGAGNIIINKGGHFLSFDNGHGTFEGINLVDFLICGSDFLMREEAYIIQYWKIFFKNDKGLRMEVPISSLPKPDSYS